MFNIVLRLNAFILLLVFGIGCGDSKDALVGEYLHDQYLRYYRTPISAYYFNTGHLPSGLSELVSNNSGTDGWSGPYTTYGTGAPNGTDYGMELIGNMCFHFGFLKEGTLGNDVYLEICIETENGAFSSIVNVVSSED